jgi:hypothetical protein
LKRKKLNRFVELIYQLNSRPKEEVKVFPTEMRYTYADGRKSPTLGMLANNGKYLLPEVQEIHKIIKAIEPTELKKECTTINQLYGFPLMLLMSTAPAGMVSRNMILTINTKHGIIVFEVHFNDEKDVPAPFTDEEIQNLRKIAPALEQKLKEDLAKEGAENGQ